MEKVAVGCLRFAVALQSLRTVNCYRFKKQKNNLLQKG
jgi:hypothetical protein